jgi:hypothetical protein
MQTFIQRWGQNILGVLSGWDRVRFRGTKRFLANTRGMINYLWQVGVLFKDFGRYAEEITGELRAATIALCQDQGRPLQYLSSSQEDKEAWALAIARRDQVRQGLIGVLSCVEPCWSYQVHRNRDTKQLDLRGGWRKCLHYYHYFLDPEIGLCHARLQTWFPFTLQVCLNGREWLGRQLQAKGIGYRRRDNCFVAVDDWDQAQALLEAQLQTDWPALLERFAAQVNPIQERMWAKAPAPYYWTAEQSEWATDVVFRSRADLATLYPSLVRHAVERMSSRDVLRYLGRKVPSAEGRYGAFSGEVVTDLKERPEGTRVKHRVNANSIKMYDKQGTVLRVETTLNQTRDMKVYRPKEGDEGGEKQWRYLRKGVADLYRRAEVCQRANERYLETLAAVEGKTPLGTLVAEVCRPTTWKGKRVRALQPLGQDAALLEAVYRGEFTVNGLRNRDLRPLLYGARKVPATEARRQSAAVTRKLRLLRAHGLIHKVAKTHRYQLSDKGREIIAALLAARQADTAKLTAAA